MISIEWFCVGQLLLLALFLAAFNWETRNKLKWFERWRKESGEHLLTQQKLAIAEYTLGIIAGRSCGKIRPDKV